MRTERLVEHCLGIDGDRPDLPAHLLDWLAVTIGGAAHADSTPSILDGVDRIAGDPPADAATILPSGKRVAPADAALANGALAHSLDFDDTHLSSSLHPGAPTIAAALAAAEAADASTERFRSGIAAGYDVACAVGEAVGPDAHYDRGFHVTATCGTFGATAAAGVVRGLDREALASAFGLAGSQAAGSLQFLANGAWNKRLHPGLAARRGIEATSLAAAGVVGAAEPLEGDHGFFTGYTDDPRPEAIDGIGERDAIAETGIKPYPCCRYLHAAIDALREIAPAVDPDAVEAVRIAIPSAGVRLTGDPIEAKRRPDGFVDCQFSAPFVAALVLHEGDAGPESFLRAVGRLSEPPRWDDPAYRRVMDLTTVTTDDAIESRFPERWGARVRVRADGTSHERAIEQPLGEPERPMSESDVRRKSTGLLAGASVDAEALATAVEELAERPLADLVDAATASV